MSKRVIFLDIDGVICTFRSHLAQSRTLGIMEHFDRESVGLIQRICEDHEFKIIVSSSWRIVHSTDMVRERWVAAGGNGNLIVGETPHRPRLLKDRGAEITAWMAENDPETIIILDDDVEDIQIYEPLAPFIVRTDLYEGFGFRDYHHCLRIISQETNSPMPREFGILRSRMAT